jgi:hypothetical protein
MVDIPLYFESGEPFAFDLPAGLMIVPIFEYEKINVSLRVSSSGKKPEQKLSEKGVWNWEIGKKIDDFIKDVLGTSEDEWDRNGGKRDTRTQSGVNLKKQRPVKYTKLREYKNRSAKIGTRASTVEDVIDPSLDPEKIYILTLSLYCLNHDGSRSLAEARYYPLYITESPLINWYLSLFENKEIENSSARERIQEILWRLTDGTYGQLNNNEINFLKNLPDK